MNKKYASLTLALVGTFLININASVSAQVPKNLIVFEKLSGVNCTACPAAVHHIHDLVDNEGAQIAVISYQTGQYSIPEYDNSDSQERRVYYNSLLAGFPTTIIGGEHVPSYNQYSDYLGFYQSEMAETSPISLSLSFVDNGNEQLTITSDLTEEVSTSSTNYKLHLSITETEIDEDWKGESFLYDVNRKMLPDYSGTAFNFTGSTTLNFSESFTIPSEWDRDYLSVIAFIQDASTGEIVQAAKISLADITLPNDAMVDRVIFDSEIYCGGEMAPIVRLRNSGGSPLTSATIDYSIAGQTGTYNWTGNLLSFEREEILLPALTFTPDFTVDLNATVSSPNGGIDDNLSNDMISQTFTHGEEFGSTPILNLRTDNFAYLTDWWLEDDQGTIIDGDGGWNWSNFTEYTTNFNLAQGCYTFVITDQTGNGFVDWTTEPGQPNETEENGYFVLINSQGDTIANMVNFGFEFRYSFSVGFALSTIENSKESFEIYPNPTNGKVVIELEELVKSSIQITDLQGGKVGTFTTNDSRLELDLSHLSKGIYIVQVSSEVGHLVKRLIIK